MTTQVNVVRILSELGQVAPWSRLQSAGATTQNMKAAMRAGSVQRIRRGVYCLPGVHSAVRSAAAHGGALTCATLLAVWGIWLLHDDPFTHVWLGAKGRAHDHLGCRCKGHFAPGRAHVGVVSMGMALGHLYRCQGIEAFICAFESALNQGKLSAAEREKVRLSLPKNARWLMDYASNRAASGL
jgi:hypothetical protein